MTRSGKSSGLRFSKGTSTLSCTKAVMSWAVALPGHKMRKIDPVWNAKAPVVVKDSIPGIARKDSMSLQDLETKTSDFINTNYPSELWIRVYTDGSAEEAVRNGGGGVLIEWLDGTKIENSIPTGRHSTNYKAEAAAIRRSSGAPPHSQVLQQKHRPSL